MAYSLCERFGDQSKHDRIPDPGVYNLDCNVIKPNKVPFLSKSRREKGSTNIYTHAIYNADKAHKIPNCSSLMSKVPRFSYEALSAEDLEEILCKCGIQDKCECPAEEIIPEKICQGKVTRRIFKGQPPRAVISDETRPCKQYDESNLEDNTPEDNCPSFYNTRVTEATSFYQGWKWSKWKSGRTETHIEERPGPADYDLNHKITDEEICAELLRAHKRQTSRQLRFIEMVQQKHILDNQPGPATYFPKFPKGNIGVRFSPTPERFEANKFLLHPGPTDHFLRRDFDRIVPPKQPCRVKLVNPAPFGVRANRFKAKVEQGASPASFDTRVRLCVFQNCSTAPFGSSAKRFREIKVKENDEYIDEDQLDEVIKPKKCPETTWEFTSKTIRMKPLIKKLDEPSPADLPQPVHTFKKSPDSQSTAPFLSSQGRFRPWYNNIPVYGMLATPGPGYYDSNKYRCIPAFNHGPLFRTPRFPQIKERSPAPNEYNINKGIETILATHNEKLKKNIQNQHTYHWNPPANPKSLSFEEREAALFKTILHIFDDLTNTGTTADEQDKADEAPSKPKVKSKLLRTFLYDNPTSHYY